MHTRLIGLVASLAVFGGVFAAGSAANESAGQGEPESEPIEMKLEVAVDRFESRDGRAYATGPVTLRTVQGEEQQETTVEQVSMRVRGTSGGGSGDGRGCQILRLHLSESFIALLGLEVTTSDINVEITGQPRRTLGKLFCKLAEGLKLDKDVLTQKTVRGLNRRLDGEDLNLLRVSAKLHPQELSAEEAGAAARAPGDGGPRCQILDLDLGPLELDLLGLAVDLYGNDRESPIHIDADADPNGGVLGEALCQVSGGPTEPTEPTP